jgi:hypothetical protein
MNETDPLMKQIAAALESDPSMKQTTAAFETDPLMEQITAALETVPYVDVPVDFAARVIARVPQQKARRIVAPALTPARYGQFASVLGMILLVAAMLYLAPQTRSSVTWQLLQALLLAQLIGLVLWFGRLRQT